MRMLRVNGNLSRCRKFTTFN